MSKRSNRHEVWKNGKRVHVGPEYPDLGATVAKFRRIGPVSKMDKVTRHAYGEAVEKAIRAKQRAELMREGTAPRNFYPVGEALRRAHRARLQAAVAKERKDRTPEQWRSMYEAAMAEKRRPRAHAVIADLGNTIGTAIREAIQDDKASKPSRSDAAKKAWATRRAKVAA